MRRTGLLMSAALAALLPHRLSAEVAPAAPQTSTAEAALNHILGNTVSGTTPDGPYFELFLPDGTFHIVDGDGKAEGRWTLKGGRLCTMVGDEEEECGSVTLDGASGAFVDQAGSRYPFVLLPGNPKGL